MTLKHFSPETDPSLYRCSGGREDCDAPAPSPLLLGLLDVMRETYGREITVRSGPRCRWYNDRPVSEGGAGGASDSEHPEGRGADLACTRSRDRWDMLRAALATGFRRIGIGPTFVHVGVGEESSGHAQDVAWTYYPR